MSSDEEFDEAEGGEVKKVGSGAAVAGGGRGQGRRAMMECLRNGLVGAADCGKRLLPATAGCRDDARGGVADTTAVPGRAPATAACAGHRRSPHRRRGRWPKLR